MDVQAKCKAVRNEEQAVSMASDGPVRLKVNEILFAAVLIAIPESPYWFVSKTVRFIMDS